MAKIATKHLDVGTAAGTVAAGNHTHAGGGAGVLLQVMAVRDTTLLQGSSDTPSPTQTSPPTSSQGFDYPQLTLTLTPSAANSLIEVEVQLSFVSALAKRYSILLFDSGSSTPTLAVAIASKSLVLGAPDTGFLKHFVVSGSVTQRTFSVRIFGVSMLMNRYWTSTPNSLGGITASSISVKEYAQ